MKNSIIIFCLFFFCQVNAQELLNKNGEQILPLKGSWGISLDATKLIKDFRFDHVSSSQAIVGKYFKDDKTVYRVGARIGINNYITKEKELDRQAATNTVIAFPAPKAMKTNTWNRTSTAFGISFGIEKRRGSTRLQGIYGVEGAVFLNTLMDKFSYGNVLNADPSAPVTVSGDDALFNGVFGNANNIDTVPPIQGVQGYARIIERKQTASVSIGARLFIGAEYFFLPRMSIGGEFGWGIAVSSTGRTEILYEAIGASNIQGKTSAEVNRTTIDSGTSNGTIIDTDNSNILGGTSATLKLNLYF